MTTRDSVAELRRRMDGLDRELRLQDLIGQAKGVLISHYAVSDAQATALLTALADETSLRLDLLATEILARVRRRPGAGLDQRLTGALEEILDDTRRAAGLDRSRQVSTLLRRVAGDTT